MAPGCIPSRCCCGAPQATPQTPHAISECWCCRWAEPRVIRPPHAPQRPKAAAGAPQFAAQAVKLPTPGCSAGTPRAARRAQARPGGRLPHMRATMEPAKPSHAPWSDAITSKSMCTQQPPPLTLLAQVRLALLHGRHDHVAGSGGWQAVQARTPAVHLQQGRQEGMSGRPGGSGEQAVACRDA